MPVPLPLPCPCSCPCPCAFALIRPRRPPYDIKNPYYAELKNHRDLMQGGDRTSIHLEILIKDTPITYATGDHVGIFPQNDPEEVERLGKRLGITDMDAVFTMTALDPSSSKKYPFPCPTTYRTALTYYLDIMSVPRTHILKAMIDFATTENDRKHLIQLTGPEGKEELHRYLHKESRHLLETLEDFPSLKPPVDLIFELLPRLQCRYYSISSSPKVRGRRGCGRGLARRAGGQGQGKQGRGLARRAGVGGAQGLRDGFHDGMATSHVSAEWCACRCNRTASACASPCSSTTPRPSGW